MLDCRQQQAVLLSRVPQASIGSMGSLEEVCWLTMLWCIDGVCDTMAEFTFISWSRFWNVWSILCPHNSLSWCRYIDLHNDDMSSLPSFPCRLSLGVWNVDGRCRSRRGQHECAHCTYGDHESHEQLRAMSRTRDRRCHHLRWQDVLRALYHRQIAALTTSSRSAKMCILNTLLDKRSYVKMPYCSWHVLPFIVDSSIHPHTGQFVTMEIEFTVDGVQSAFQKIESVGYLALFSLLKHENKLSIMHCNVQRNEIAGDTSIIKSKEELFFQVHIIYLISYFLSQEAVCKISITSRSEHRHLIPLSSLIV